MGGDGVDTCDVAPRDAGEVGFAGNQQAQPQQSIAVTEAEAAAGAPAASARRRSSTSSGTGRERNRRKSASSQPWDGDNHKIASDLMQRDGVAPCSTAAGEIEDGGWTLSSHAELLDTAKTQSVERPSRPSAEEARGNESPVVPNTASQSGSSARRSSRRSVKPVAYWRNERVKYVFEQCDAGVPVLSIKDVVHNPPATSHCRNSKRRKVDRAEASPPSATASRESPIRASLLRRDEETEPFVSTKEVHADANTVNPDHIPTLPHGPAPTAITVSDYSSGKKVTLDLVRLLENVNPTEVVPGGFLVEQVFKFGNFCGAGVLIFETGAEKPPKNTRGHVMIFYVTAGCLRVRLHETEFEAAKGTFFAVPQGNVYSMLNAEKETASVLFLQARQIAER